MKLNKENSSTLAQDASGKFSLMVSLTPGRIASLVDSLVTQKNRAITSTFLKNYKRLLRFELEKAQCHNRNRERSGPRDTLRN